MRWWVIVFLPCLISEAAVRVGVMGYPVGLSGVSPNVLDRFERKLKAHLESRPEFGILVTPLGNRENLLSSEVETREPEVREEARAGTPHSGCRVSLETHPAQAKVSLGETDFGSRRSFELRIGVNHYGWIRSEGFYPREIRFDCSMPTQWVESVALSAGVDLAESFLARLRRFTLGLKLSGVVFWHFSADRALAIALYLPGVGVIGIPMGEKLAIDALVSEDYVLPSIVEQVGALMSGSKAASVEARKVDFLAPLPRASESTVARRDFWWLVGVTGAAVLTGLLVNQGQGGGRTSGAGSATVD